MTPNTVSGRRAGGAVHTPTPPHSHPSATLPLGTMPHLAHTSPTFTDIAYIERGNTAGTRRGTADPALAEPRLSPPLERADRLDPRLAGDADRLPAARPRPHRLTGHRRLRGGGAHRPLSPLRPARRCARRPLGPQADDDHLRQRQRPGPGECRHRLSARRPRHPADRRRFVHRRGLRGHLRPRRDFRPAARGPSGADFGRRRPASSNTRSAVSSGRRSVAHSTAPRRSYRSPSMPLRMPPPASP